MIATLLKIAGCGEACSGAGSMVGEGFVVFMEHNSPVDDETEIRLYVGSVTMIGSEADGHRGWSSRTVLGPALRRDFAIAGIGAGDGMQLKTRFQVSNQEFAGDDDGVCTGDDMHLP